MKRFPFLYEPQTSNVGACCLKMIAKHYGKSISFSTLSESMLSGEYRDSLFEISESAESVGFDTLAVKMPFENLRDKAPLPCIVHWQKNHFVVVYKIDRNRVFFADPHIGKRRCSSDEFIKTWTVSTKKSNSITAPAGIVLLLEPTPDFFTRINEIEKRPMNSKFGMFWDKIKRAIENKRRIKLRQTIVKLPPSPLPDTKSNLNAHMLLGKKHVEMAICTCKALNLAAGSSFSFVFHDDGSLTQSDFDKLLFQFPGSLVIDRDIADKIANEKLNHYPNCRFFRDNNIMWLKVFDILFWSDNRSRIVNIDSDIIFFNKPEQFIRGLNDPDEDNLFNRDIGTGYFYGLDKKTLTALIGQEVVPRINAGLWVVDRSFIDLELIEKWLSPEFVRNRAGYGAMEQTIMAALGTLKIKKNIYFDEDYDVDLEKDIGDTVCKHYVGTIRSKYELEGLRFLLKDGKFAKRWKEFVQSNCES